jgi:hypothetical protein
MTDAKELNERWIRAFNERDWEADTRLAGQRGLGGFHGHVHERLH